MSGEPYKTWQCGTCGFIYDEAAGLIEEILQEEKAADEALTDLAHDKNEEARAETVS